MARLGDDMAQRPIKATLIKGARGFVAKDGTPGLRLYPMDGEPFEIAFEAASIPRIRSSLDDVEALLKSGRTGTLH